MSGATVSSAEPRGREQMAEQHLEAGLPFPEPQTPARGRCPRSGLGIWVWP